MFPGRFISPAPQFILTPSAGSIPANIQLRSVQFHIGKINDTTNQITELSRPAGPLDSQKRFIRSAKPEIMQYQPFGKRTEFSPLHRNRTFCRPGYPRHKQSCQKKRAGKKEKSCRKQKYHCQQQEKYDFTPTHGSGCYRKTLRSSTWNS